MKEKTSLSIVLVISTLWHIFLIFAVLIVILPKGFDFVKFPTVSFLGPILNEEAFRLDISSNQSQIWSPYKKNFHSDNLSRSDSIATAQRVFVNYEKDIITSAPLDSMMDKKVFYYTREFPVYKKFEKEESFAGSDNIVKIEGPLKSRTIFFKPQLPVLPKWTESSNIEFKMEFKILVSDKGNVMLVERLISSGYPDIDILMSRYLSRWQFVAIVQGTREVSYGKVSIDLSSK